MNETTDRLLADWLHAGPEMGPRAGLERTLAATRRVGQRPAWTLLERWLPMQLTMARTRSQRPILALVTLALLMLALFAAALYIGSLRLQSPPPFRNGAIVYEQDGDLFMADQLDGTSRALVAGPAEDSDPIFSNQGDRIAFIRDTPNDSKIVMAVAIDGSDVKELATLPGLVERLDWSPDGSALLARSRFPGPTEIHLINSDGSGYRTLDFGPTVYGLSASWRPDGRHIAFVGGQVVPPDVYNDDADEVFIADADGTNVRSLAIGSVGRVAWSADGKHLSFVSPGDDIGVADIDQNGAVTDLRRLNLVVEFPPSGSGLMWSPDGSQLAFVQMVDSVPRAGLVNADGSGYRLVGPEGSNHRALDIIWAPDGRSLVIFEHPLGVRGVPVGPMANVWSVDVATGEQTEVQTPVESWQRLAP